MADRTFNKPRNSARGIAAPLPIPNLDTDQIMPKQFLRGIDKSGLAGGVFHDLRFASDGSERPDFVLNRVEYRETSILVAAENFGCGSSREHAVWGLLQFGIVAVVAPSFGEIFYSNALNNGLIAAVVSSADSSALMTEVSGPIASEVTIDLLAQTVQSEGVTAPFRMSRRHRSMLLAGHDAVAAAIARSKLIDAFSERHFVRQPWLRDLGDFARRAAARADDGEAAVTDGPDTTRTLGRFAIRGVESLAEEDR